MSSAIVEIGLSNALVATLLAVIAFAVTRRMRPQWALAVWLLVLAKLLMPPLWTAPLGSLRGFVPTEEATEFVAWTEFSSSNADESIVLMPPNTTALPAHELAGAASTDTFTESSALTFSLPLMILLVWLAGSLLWSILAARRIYRFNTLLRQTRLAPAAALVELAALASEMGLRRTPELRITTRRIAPLVWAFGRGSTILLPAALLETLLAEERRALLLHELAHLRRRDHFTKLVELAAVAIYWWLPTAWWARRQADRATEGCCDAEVVSRLPAGSRSYASALIKTIDFLSGPNEPLPLGASGFSQFRHVSRRIEMILEPAPVSRSRWRHRLALIAFGAVVLPVSISSLWAEPPTLDDAESEAALQSPGHDGDAAAENPSTQLPATNDAEHTTEQKANLFVWHDGPVEDEENPRSQYRFTRDASLSAELNFVKALDLAQHVAKSDAILKEYYGKKGLHAAQAELARLEQNATERWQQKMVVIRDHLRMHLATMEKQFAAGEAPVDKLIEVQQRIANHEAALARAICPRDWSGEILRMQANYMVSLEATNRARLTWKHVSQAGPGKAEIATEALAREHFDQCQQQLQNVVQAACGNFIQFVREGESDRNMRREISAAIRAEWRMFAIAGPTTTGPQIGELEPPMDDGILEALNRKLFADGSSSVDGNVRMVKELCRTYTDQARTYPGVGEAQRHHAIYRVTVDFVAVGGKQATEVFYIDHQHLHRMGDAGQQTRIDELEAQTKRFMFGEGAPTPPRQAATAQATEGGAFEISASGGEFKLSEDRGKDWLSNHDYISIDRVAFEAKMKSLADELKVNSAHVESNATRRAATARQVAAMEAAFEAGTVTIDQLLEAQRRHAYAEAVYYQSILEAASESPEHRRLLREANVIVCQDAMNGARRTWQKVYAKYRKTSADSEAREANEAAVEAQAREQYYQFKSQFERVRRNYEQELDRRTSVVQEPTPQSSDQSRRESEKSFHAEMDRVSVAGPVTTGDKMTTLDPPSDDEVLRALATLVSGEYRLVPGKSRRIVKELVATYTDPPKWHPKLFATAQLHHAHYKCTVNYDDSQGKLQEEVFYVDHNHLHRSANSGSFDEFQSGPFHSTFSRGFRKEAVQFRHVQLQLARQKAKLADMRQEAGSPRTADQDAELVKLQQDIAVRQHQLGLAAHKAIQFAVNPGLAAQKQ